MASFHFRFQRLMIATAVIAVLLTAAGLQTRAQQMVASSRHIAANESPSGAMTPAAPGIAPGSQNRGAAGTDQNNPSKAPENAPPGKTSNGARPEEPEESAFFEREPPTRVRISILNATGTPDGAAKVAVLLGEYRRRPLEDKMGLKIELVNISTGYERVAAPVAVYYRPGFLRAALLLARAIPGDTVVSAMRPQALKRAGVDVEVVVGRTLP